MNTAVEAFDNTRADTERSPAAEPVRIAIVDDHIILRQGLRALLEIETDLEIVGEAGTAADAVELVRRTQPAVVLSDISLPDKSGLALISDLRALCPSIRILMLTAYSSEDYIRVALNSNADGYVLKDSSRAELLGAIRAISRGDRYVCTTITNRLVWGFLGVGDQPKATGTASKITEREREVLTRIALGMPNKLIAKELDLAVKTVEKHRSNLMRKLSIHNTAEVTMYAVRNGLVSAENRADEKFA
ncbi:MAG: response regulator transcription factor [Gammaproteobacteria bacterium]|nr:response regulator transcription factor [Gammaproteobacteria bacterium]